MDIRKVKKLIELLEASSIGEIEIKEGEETVRISRASQAPSTPSAPQQVVAPVHAPAPPSPSASLSGAPAPQSAESDEDYQGTVVRSPMVGTFYRSSAPGEKPFVEEGGAVTSGSPVCIIEAMKMMNHIDSPVSGTVSKILVQDGEPVEFDQVLLVIEPS